MKRRKVGIVSEFFYPHIGGITEHIYFFSKELSKRGFEITLITGAMESEPDVGLPPNFRIIRIGRSHSVYTGNSFTRVTFGWNLKKRIKQVLEEESFDLLHIHSPNTPTLPILFQKYTNTVTIGTCHSYFEPNIFYAAFRNGIQRYMDKLDGLIAVGPACVEAMDRYVRANYTIIPNGVDTAWFHPEGNRIEAFNDGRPNLLFLGRPEPRNGLSDLLRAFPLVKKKVPETRLLIVGEGPLRKAYEKQAEGFKDDVAFCGMQNGHRPAYYRSATLFCFPVQMAAFPITLLEGMASGCPIVSSKNHAIREVVTDQVHCVKADVDNPHAFASAIVSLLKDERGRRELSAKARERAESYSWPRITDRILDYYNQVYQRVKGETFYR